jgi:hypothetical protein
MGNVHRELKITFTPIPQPDKWVFVVGCYNSGTTLLSEVLGTHHKISSLPTEGQYLTDQFPSDHKIGLSRMWVQREDLYRLNENDEGPDVNRLKKEWAMRFNLTKPILLEKTPANSARIRWLEKNFENAYFVGIVRNGYAASEGISRKAQPIHLKSGWSIEQAAYQWYRSNHLLLEDSKHVNNFMWMKYEDFTADPQKEINRVMDFLGLSGEGGIDLSQDWSIHERKQTIKNLNHENIDKLSDDQIESITTIAKDMLLEFGYPLMD